MKIYSIVKEQEQTINSAEDLANAFDENQWHSIYAHFASANNTSLGDNRPTIARRFAQIDQYLGPNMPRNLNNFDWLRRARRWKLAPPGNPRATWQAIYNHLAPHADTDIATALGAPWQDNTDPGISGQSTPTPNTPESVEELIALVSDPQTELTTPAELSAFYDQFIGVFWPRRNEEWQRKSTCTTASGGLTSVMQALEDRYNSWASDLPITKETVIRGFHIWLTRADAVFADENFCPPGGNG